MFSYVASLHPAVLITVACLFILFLDFVVIKFVSLRWSAWKLSRASKTKQDSVTPSESSSSPWADRRQLLQAEAKAKSGSSSVNTSTGEVTSHSVHVSNGCDVLAFTAIPQAVIDELAVKRLQKQLSVRSNLASLVVKTHRKRKFVGPKFVRTSIPVVKGV